jgi:hypothetical protein
MSQEKQAEEKRKKRSQRNYSYSQVSTLVFSLNKTKKESYFNDHQRDLQLTNFWTHLSCLYTQTHMPFIHILICIHLFLFSFRSIQLCWTFITRSLHGIFFFVQTTAECTRTHTPTQIYTRAIQWEEQEKGKIKKKWDDRCCAITFFFLFFSFLSFRVGWTICFCLEFFFLCLLYISSNDELLSQTHWTGMLSCIYIYISERKEKKNFSSRQFNLIFINVGRCPFSSCFR